VNEFDVQQVKNVGVIHQMVATRRNAGSIDDRDVIRLTSVDAKDMLDLERRTKPGPFAKRTHETGSYIGIRDRGRLVAMAGERMQFEGYVEISAVCVDDEWRGRGLAARLIQLLGKEITRG
jgi:predicted GNAT family acetyltransferase